VIAELTRLGRQRQGNRAGAENDQRGLRHTRITKKKKLSMVPLSGTCWGEAHARRGSRRGLTRVRPKRFSGCTEPCAARLGQASRGPPSAPRTLGAAGPAGHPARDDGCRPERMSRFAPAFARRHRHPCARRSPPRRTKACSAAFICATQSITSQMGGSSFRPPTISPNTVRARSGLQVLDGRNRRSMCGSAALMPARNACVAFPAIHGHEPDDAGGSASQGLPHLATSSAGFAGSRSREGRSSRRCGNGSRAPSGHRLKASGSRPIRVPPHRDCGQAETKAISSGPASSNYGVGDEANLCENRNARPAKFVEHDMDEGRTRWGTANRARDASKQHAMPQTACP